MKFSRIKSIKKINLKKPLPVYDISVRDNNNFALSSGLIVHNCQPYQYLKNTIYEERLILFENNLLTEELLGLERNNSNGKVDHAPSGINSKDSADALCGAIWNASQHGEEFNFEFGETLDTIVDVSSESSEDNTKKQLVVNFEDELKRASDAFGQSLKDNKSAYTDFGLGPSTTDYALFGDCLII